MKKLVPKEIDDILGITPTAIHSAFLIDFYSSVNQTRELNYYPCSVDEFDGNEKTLSELKETANNAYVQLIENGLFWEFCSFEVYKKTYNSRKEDFFKTYIDAEEYDFLLEEINGLNALLSETIEYIDESGYPRDTDTELLSTILNEVNFKNINFSNSKKSLFISEKISKIEQSFNNTAPNSLAWIGGQTELIELIKALIVNGNIKGIQKDIINEITSFFNIDIKHPDKLIVDIKNRNTGSETLFIDKLKSSLYDYITKENTR